MIGVWDDEFLDEMDPSIEYLELYALTVGVKLWLKFFRNSRLVLFCDNQSVVHMVNNQSSKCKNCIILIRIIVLESLIQNSRVFVWHVKGLDNKFLDYLSRGKLQKFHNLAHQEGKNFNGRPDDVPEEIFLHRNSGFFKLIYAIDAIHIPCTLEGNIQFKFLS